MFMLSRAEMGTTGTPRLAASRPQSMTSPFFSTSSMKFTASTTGRSSSSSCMVR